MKMELKINGKNTEIRVTDAYSAKFGKVDALYTSVIFEDKMLCEIQYDKAPESAVIRPQSLGIKPEIKGNSVIFELNKPCNISAEINDGIEDALIIFAEEREEMPCGFENVIAFEKGEHDVGEISITKDNTLVWFAEGAVVNGKITAENANNIAICGNGIITMESYERGAPMNRAVDILHCKNVRVSGIKIIDSCNWCLRVFGCDDVLINNVRIIGHRGNSDGVDVCGSRNVHVTGVFTRVMDDSLVLKAFDTGDVENVLFENCTLWNDFARPIEIGVEIRADKAHNIRFKNIDIIHTMVGYPCMGIHHGDRAEVYDIVVDDVRIEDAPGAQLFDLRITDSVWNRDTKKGCIHDITFKNISLIGKPGIDVLPSNSRIQGFSEENNIDNIIFENISLMGKQATTPEECGLLIQDYASNVKFIANADEEKINFVKTDISIGNEFVLMPNGRYVGSVVVTAENTADSEISSHFRLQANPVHSAEFDNKYYEFTLKGHEKISKEYKVTAIPGNYVFSVQSDDVNVISGWLFKRFDFVIANGVDSKYSVCDYFGNKSEELEFSANDKFLTIKSEVLKKSNIIIYTAMPVETADNQVIFTVPETDFGEAPALINGPHGYELAPQLRCPAEITYVFKNEPKVEKITKIQIEKKHSGVVRLPFEYIGIQPGTKNFWMEIEIQADNKYPYTMFRSAQPTTMAHMFANVIIKN